MKAIVTGAAGFIGFHVARRLAGEGFDVIAIDNLNDYYPVALKEARLSALDGHVQYPICPRRYHRPQGTRCRHWRGCGCRHHRPSRRAGRRAVLGREPCSLCRCQCPWSGDGIRAGAAKCRSVRLWSTPAHRRSTAPIPRCHFRKAIPSIIPFRYTLQQSVRLSFSLTPIGTFTIVASTGLRFFTVYGPYGRPDMAPWLFTDAILKGEPIKVYNHGRMERDFTFIDDIVNGVFGAVNRILADPARYGASLQSRKQQACCPDAFYRDHRKGLRPRSNQTTGANAARRR